MIRTRSFGIALIASASLVLAGCSDSEESEGAVTSATEGAENSAADATTDDAAADEAASGFTLENGVVRATVEDNPMTSVFGTLHNDTDEDIHIVGVDADVEAGSYEMHEVVDGVMQEKEGGITIPAGESHELAPGGDHFMFMELSEPIEAGDVVTITLELGDGSEVTLADVPVRTMAAGDEDYGDMGGMDHGEMEHEH